MLEGSDLNDSAILSSTLQETGEDGKVRYTTVLPNGEPLVSEWMNPGDMSGKIVIKWCDLVRQQVDAHAREEEARRQRAMDDGVDLSEEVQEEVRKSRVSEATDPIAFALEQRDLYQERINFLEERYGSIKVELKQTRLHLENWETIVASLRGEQDD